MPEPTHLTGQWQVEILETQNGLIGHKPNPWTTRNATWASLFFIIFF